CSWCLELLDVSLPVQREQCLECLFELLSVSRTDAQALRLGREERRSRMELMRVPPCIALRLGAEAPISNPCPDLTTYLEIRRARRVTKELFDKPPFRRVRRG